MNTQSYKNKTALRIVNGFIALVIVIVLFGICCGMKAYADDITWTQFTDFVYSDDLLEEADTLADLIIGDTDPDEHQKYVDEHISMCMPTVYVIGNPDDYKITVTGMQHFSVTLVNDSIFSDDDTDVAISNGDAAQLYSFDNVYVVYRYNNAYYIFNSAYSYKAESDGSNGETVYFFEAPEGLTGDVDFTDFCFHEEANLYFNGSYAFLRIKTDDRIAATGESSIESIENSLSEASAPEMAEASSLWKKLSVSGSNITFYMYGSSSNVSILQTGSGYMYSRGGTNAATCDLGAADSASGWTLQSLPSGYPVLTYYDSSNAKYYILDAGVYVSSAGTGGTTRMYMWISVDVGPDTDYSSDISGYRSVAVSKSGNTVVVSATPNYTTAALDGYYISGQGLPEEKADSDIDIGFKTLESDDAENAGNQETPDILPESESDSRPESVNTNSFFKVADNRYLALIGTGLSDDAGLHTDIDTLKRYRESEAQITALINGRYSSGLDEPCEVMDATDLQAENGVVPSVNYIILGTSVSNNVYLIDRDTIGELTVYNTSSIPGIENFGGAGGCASKVVTLREPDAENGYINWLEMAEYRETYGMDTYYQYSDDGSELAIGDRDKVADYINPTTAESPEPDTAVTAEQPAEESAEEPVEEPVEEPAEIVVCSNEQ